MTSQFYPPQRYVSLENNRGPLPHPPQHQYQYQYRPPRGGSGCGFLKCLCCCFYFSCCRWCMCILLTLIVFMIGILLALYYLLQPHVPSYNVENLEVKGFDLKNGKLYSEIAVYVRADNPNKGISLEYLENEVTINYTGTQLSQGQFPSFVQPGKNITNLNVDMKGDVDFGPDMQHKLLADQKMGIIPLLIDVKVPVRVIFDDFIRLRKFIVNVKCSVVIDKLQPRMRPKILQNVCIYGFGL